MSVMNCSARTTGGESIVTLRAARGSCNSPPACQAYMYSQLLPVFGREAEARDAAVLVAGHAIERELRSRIRRSSSQFLGGFGSPFSSTSPACRSTIAVR